MEMVKHSQSSQNSKFAMSLQYLKKEVRNEVDFVHVNKHQSFFQLDPNNLGIKIYYKVILTLLMGAWSRILKVLNLISFQYLYNISKEKIALKLFNKNMTNKILHAE